MPENNDVFEEAINAIFAELNDEKAPTVDDYSQKKWDNAALEALIELVANGSKGEHPPMLKEKLFAGLAIYRMGQDSMMRNFMPVASGMLIVSDEGLSSFITEMLIMFNALTDLVVTKAMAGSDGSE